MNRRSFLQALLATGATIILPGGRQLEKVSEKEENLQEFDFDGFHIRCDTRDDMCGALQIYADNGTYCMAMLFDAAKPVDECVTEFKKTLRMAQKRRKTC